MPSINTMEYSIFSQNGEDGIIAFLSSGLLENHRKFLEIGTSDGVQNNTAYLLKKGWSGVGVDADAANIRRYAQRIAGTPIESRLTLSDLKVNWDNCESLMGLVGSMSPDFFSLDIDSIDYYVAYRLLHAGFRPSIVCCEINPFLGSKPVTVVYDERFSRYGYDRERGLYFGVSVAAWRHLFGQFGYRFLGVDSSGVNAFFGLPEAFTPGFIDTVEGLETAYSTVFVKKYGLSGEQLEQDLLARTDLAFVDVTQADIAALVKQAPVPVIASPTSVAKARPPVIHVVTTFHAKGYEQFGKRFIESFLQHWPEETRLWVMAEGCQPEGNERVFVRDLMACDDLVAFKQRHLSNPGAHGHFGERYDYMHDAIRWCHRIFALREAAEMSAADILINIDADIVCFDDMPFEFLSTLMPADADIGYMPRQRMYSECSFVLYRIGAEKALDFIREHTAYYVSDKIFKLPFWTDCHPFDLMVASHRKKGDMVFHNINDGIPDSMHPFINGPLGSYMDHLKGDRKDEGRSREQDLVVARNEAYWKNKAAGA